MDYINLIVFFFLLGLGYFVGSFRERAHYKSIRRREEETRSTAVVTGKKMADCEREILEAKLVAGNVVVAQDYFKRILARLKNVFGGSIGAYESLLDRARREALLRLKEEFPEADLIANLRFETSTIGYSADKKTAGSIEVLAYGTAIKYK